MNPNSTSSPPNEETPLIVENRNHNLIKFIRIFLLILIVIGLGLLITQDRWVSKLVDKIIGDEFTDLETATPESTGTETPFIPAGVEGSTQVGLPGVVEFYFPPGFLPATANVTVNKIQDQELYHTFHELAELMGTGTSTDYQVQLFIGMDYPVGGSYSATFHVPPEVVVSEDEKAIVFAQLYQDGGMEILDHFEYMPSAWDKEKRTINVSLRNYTFTNKRYENGQYGANFIIGVGEKGAADKVIEALRERDATALSEHVHPEMGLRISTWGATSTSDVVLSKEQVAKAFTDPTKRNWGSYMNLDRDIRLTFSELYDSFLYRRNFASAPPTQTDRAYWEHPKYGWTTMETVLYSLEGDPNAARADDWYWSEISLVFYTFYTKPYLIGIIHNAYSI